jgi:hypothetical protein
MARYRWRDCHYADVECAYAEPERHLVLSCNDKRAAGKKKATKLVALVIRSCWRNDRALFANDAAS